MSTTLKISSKKVLEENKKYEALCLSTEQVEAQNKNISQNILDGKGIFADLPFTEKKILLGFSGLLAELQMAITKPFDYSGEEGNKLKRYQIRYAAVQTAYEIEKTCLINGEVELTDLLVMKTLDIINTMNISAEKADAKDGSNIFSIVLALMEWKKLYVELKNIMHSYVRMRAEHMKLVADSIWQNSEIQKLYGDDGIEGLQYDLNIFEYINHKTIDYLFSEKVFNKVINILKSFKGLGDTLSEIRISLKDICSSK